MCPKSNSSQTHQRIGEMLLNSGLVTRAELEAALKIQEDTGARVVNILISQGVLNSREFVEFLSEPGSFPTLDLVNFGIEPGVIALIPKRFALLNEIVPIDRLGRTLTVGMMCPLDEKTLKALEELTELHVKPLLCSADDIHTCLKRYYGDDKEKKTSRSVETIEGPLKLTTAVTMLRHVESLPALPGTVHRVRDLVFDQDGSGAEVAEVISHDPAIAAKMLRIANSAAYGMPNRVDDIQLAVSLLGLTETYSVVVSSAVINVMDASRSFDYVTFWLEAMSTAMLAKVVSLSVDGRDRLGLFSSGLLHDLGRLALAHVAPRHYSNIDASLAGRELVSAEEKILGLTHTEAGHQLATHWGLPEEMCEAIRYHHTPSYASEDFRITVSIINIADVLSRVHRVESDISDIQFPECLESMRYLDLTEEDIIETIETVPRIDTSEAMRWMD